MTQSKFFIIYYSVFLADENFHRSTIGYLSNSRTSCLFNIYISFNRVTFLYPLTFLNFNFKTVSIYIGF